MLNRYELKHLDDLLIQTDELTEYKKLNPYLPISVKKAVDHYEKQLNIEIKRMIQAQDNTMTVLQAKQMARTMIYSMT